MAFRLDNGTGPPTILRMKPRLAPLFAACLAFAACSSTPPVDRDAFLALGIANSFAPPLPEVVCSGQMTESQFDRLPSVGIRRVISLRKLGEDGTGWEEARALQLGIEFVRIGIGGAPDLTRANVDRLDQALAAGGPALVACGSSNRVGALLALRAFHAGTPAAEALALGKQCGLTRLQPAVEQAMAK